MGLFFNIQWIFNPQKVVESWDSGLFNHTIYTIYINTVDTRQGSLMHSMLSMSTLSIQFSHLIVLWKRCHVRATNTSVDSVDKHSIKCIVCFDLHIDSVDKQNTLLNTQKHCFDLLYWPSRHAFMSIRTTMQILIWSLRITVKFNLNPWFTLNYNRVRIKTSN